ncbi:MAG TPA: efflux transporter outer membrane subunit [Kiritimatiellia bacterium]|nr:efflux transporter outer membrane subunit [Kiritimatiellia bacterium]
MSARWLALCGVALPLAGCVSVGPDYRPPDRFAGVAWIDATKDATPERNENEQNPFPAWWDGFGDALLSSYIERAARDNRAVQAAEARVERAQALRRSVRAEAGPKVNAEAGVTRRRESRSLSDGDDDRGYRTAYDLGLSASWELDLFGGVRRAGEAAVARVEGEVERRRAVLLAVQAEVARNYFAVRGAQKRIAITRANIDLQSKTYALIENLRRFGEASEFDLSRARGQLQLTQSRLPALDAEVRAGIHRLSILLGETPGALLAELEAPAALPALPDLAPLGQGSDLLRRRPDIRAAERALAAATADIGAATADLFPRFDLLGGLGRTGATVDDLRSSLSTRYLGAGFIRWPVFQSGQIRAGIQAEKAEAREAAALYEQTVLEALADAETALVRYMSQRETKAMLRDAVASRQRSVALARQLFESGEENFLAVLDAERELISAEDELVNTETDAVLALVTLYTALGGGWELFEE